MAGTWQVKLINPEDAVREIVFKIWSGVMSDMQRWMRKELVPALVYGSASDKGNMGLQGIANTPFYAYITSPDGLSQLGIEIVDAIKLLRAYESTIQVVHNNKMVVLKFGDMAQIKLATPHPEAKDRSLGIQSWLEWIVDGVPVPDAGFVPRSNLPTDAQKKIRVKSSPGGLMLPKGKFGSTGTWKFPQQFANYDRDWLAANAASIERIIVDQATVFFTKRAK